MARSLMLVGLIASSALAAPGDAPEVRKLLEQRVALLKKALEAKEADVKAGIILTIDLHGAARDLAQAELKLADTPAKRREIYLRLFKMAVWDDEFATASYESTGSKPADWLRARSARLKAEIELRRAGGVPPKDTKPPRDPKEPKGD